MIKATLEATFTGWQLPFYFQSFIWEGNMPLSYLSQWSFRFPCNSIALIQPHAWRKECTNPERAVVRRVPATASKCQCTQEPSVKDSAWLVHLIIPSKEVIEDIVKTMFLNFRQLCSTCIILDKISKGVHQDLCKRVHITLLLVLAKTLKSTYTSNNIQLSD